MKSIVQAFEETFSIPLLYPVLYIFLCFLSFLISPPEQNTSLKQGGSYLVYLRDIHYFYLLSLMLTDKHRHEHVQKSTVALIIFPFFLMSYLALKLCHTLDEYFCSENILYTKYNSGQQLLFQMSKSI